ncbi:MAG: choice-of-anchor L domain-containing protein [Acidobacteria bacterium]|nr:choice-of-anchor L domain-containing protein [Acidobacteriota bacterium]
MKRTAKLIAVLLLAVPAAGQIITTDLSGTTPQALGALLAGSGATITNVTFTGADVAAGTFSGGTSANLGLESGVILSTGNISDIAGPNDDEGKTTSHSTAGDPDLDGLVSPLTTRDAAILEFDVVTSTPELAILYVFASEEYKEFVGSSFNDVFGFFVDGQNIAFVLGDPGKTVSINSINHESNSEFYVDNPVGSGNANTQFDGFTRQLLATTAITPGVVHHVKLAIADTSDTVLDSAVILAAGGITGGAAQIVPTPALRQVTAAESAHFDLEIFGVPEDFVLNLEPFDLPEGWTAVLGDSSVVGNEDESVLTTTLTVTPDPNSFPRPYTVQVRGFGERGSIENGDFLELETFGLMTVEIVCDPPLILSLADHQPKSMNVADGEVVTLSVQVTGGSEPYRYQWYWGPAGSTKFPILDATGPTYVTPPIQRVSQFWVLVSNACGTAESWTATLVPEGKTAPKQPEGRRRGVSRGDGD